jgi:hypothetical protein
MSEVEAQYTAPPMKASLFDNADVSMSTIESSDETSPPPLPAVLYWTMQFDKVKLENDETPTAPPAIDALFKVKRHDESWT